ncbi:MAG TPA: AHH domain-containing protein, partial [Polyangium sp.]|nr:AHH domain-containing protein [Polyangium sp.]
KRLENVPIFIPVANGGMGTVVRAGTLMGSMSAKMHRYYLRKALEVKLKRSMAAGESTHHIVPIESIREGADKCRQLFAKFKLDIDKEYNGVFLPATKNSPNPRGSIVHATLDNPTYYKKVAKSLNEAKTQADALERLRKIRKTLLDGTFYDAVL